jgi:hypothetical protein
LWEMRVSGRVALRSVCVRVFFIFARISAPPPPAPRSLLSRTTTRFNPRMRFHAGLADHSLIFETLSWGLGKESFCFRSFPFRIILVMPSFANPSVLLARHALSRTHVVSRAILSLFSPSSLPLLSFLDSIHTPHSSSAHSRNPSYTYDGALLILRPGTRRIAVCRQPPHGPRLQIVFSRQVLFGQLFHRHL